MKQLIRLFYKDPSHSYSIRSLAQKLNKAYSYVYGQVNALTQKGVLKKRKFGAAIYCSLNYGNDDLLRLLIEIEGDNFEEFLKIEKKLSKPLRELKDRLPERTSFNLFSTVLFGSYAKRNAVAKSDLDLLFIVSLKDQYREIIESETHSLSRRYRMNINPVLAEPMEFVKMIRAKEPNLAHEIIGNKIILNGREKFWELCPQGSDKMKEKLLKLKIDGYVQSRDLYEDKNFVVLTPYYLDKSRHNLETASLLFKLSEDNQSKKALTLREDYHAYDWVISASYYAMFHAATAALGSLGLRTRTHECLIEALEYLFVHKRNILETEMIKKIIHLKSLEKRYIDRMWSIKSRRNTAHYKAEESISRSDSQMSLKDAYEFVDRVEELIDELKE